MALPPPILYDPGRHHHLLAQFASIHAACIINDNQLASFLPNSDRSMDHMKLLAYWQSRSEDVKRGLRFIVLQLTDLEGAEVAGYVCLYMPPSETGPFRGEVEKLMVSPDHRFKGVARRVMGKLESEAVERGRWLMILDTTVGTPAEIVYPRLGYTSWGVLPNYGFSPKDGSLVDERWFFKDLRQ